MIFFSHYRNIRITLDPLFNNFKKEKNQTDTLVIRILLQLSRSYQIPLIWCIDDSLDILILFSHYRNFRITLDPLFNNFKKEKNQTVLKLAQWLVTAHLYYWYYDALRMRKNKLLFYSAVIYACVWQIGGSLSKVVVHWTVDQLVKVSILHLVHIHSNIHLISPGCPWP